MTEQERKEQSEIDKAKAQIAKAEDTLCRIYREQVERMSPVQVGDRFTHKYYRYTYECVGFSSDTSGGYVEIRRVNTWGGLSMHHSSPLRAWDFPNITLVPRGTP